MHYIMPVRGTQGSFGISGFFKAGPRSLRRAPAHPLVSFIGKIMTFFRMF
jgi:hypothetical protein